MALVAGVVLGGVTGGIEKFSKVAMPALFLLILVILIYALTLPGSGRGVEYLIRPDFSKLTADVCAAALGQAFFSLSLGGNGSIIYGSYLSKKENIPNSALLVAVFDTLAALLAAFVIIPAMAAGNGPLDSGGPGLMFVYLVNVMNGMPGGRIVGMVFFICVLFAGLSSIVNLYEAPVALLQDKFSFKRPAAVGTICGIGMVVSLLIQPWTSQWMDLVSIYIAPFGALLAGIMFFWVLKPETALAAVNEGSPEPIGSWFLPLGKYGFCILCAAALILGAALGGIG
jgi:NSS family neurotransmitter:Na+ symporter